MKAMLGLARTIASAVLTAWRCGVAGVRRAGVTRPGCGRSGCADRGAITAETAVALPALVFVLVIGVWGVTAVGAQVACIDAARAGARAAARGEPVAAVRAEVSRAAPQGASVEIHRDPQLTRVVVHVTVGPPGAAVFPPLMLRAQATAATEPDTAQARTASVVTGGVRSQAGAASVVAGGVRGSERSGFGRGKRCSWPETVRLRPWREEVFVAEGGAGSVVSGGSVRG